MIAAFDFHRRRALRKLAAAVLAAIGASSLQPGSAMAQPNPSLMLFGDSLLAGYGLDAGDGFAAQLGSRLAREGYEVSIVDAGISGDTSGDGLARVAGALSNMPDLALVGFGGNDMLQGLPPARLKRNLRSILEEFRSNGIPVLLLGMLASPRLGDDYVREFNAVYRELAGEFDVPLYPFFLDGVALDPYLNQDDRIHPNARGVSVIVDRILPAVRDLLDRVG